MAKRHTDSEIWTRQRWFKKLSKDYKLAFFYIKDMCDNIGVWNIDCADLVEDTGIEDFDLSDFIAHCNKEYDKRTGKPTSKVRLKIINETELWITGFCQFQYENKVTKIISHEHQIWYSAYFKLLEKGLVKEAVDKRYIVVNQFPIKKQTAARNGSGQFSREPSGGQGN